MKNCCSIFFIFVFTCSIQAAGESQSIKQKKTFTTNILPNHLPCGNTVLLNISTTKEENNKKTIGQVFQIIKKSDSLETYSKTELSDDFLNKPELRESIMIMAQQQRAVVLTFLDYLRTHGLLNDFLMRRFDLSVTDDNKKG